MGLRNRKETDTEESASQGQLSLIYHAQLKGEQDTLIWSEPSELRSNSRCWMKSMKALASAV
jgi:hypothetical protein